MSERKKRAMVAQPRRVSWRADELTGPRTRMKIHERLKSKAVDIHIQKMASLTLNGHHYAWLPTRLRARTRTRVVECACAPGHTLRNSQGKPRACSARYTLALAVLAASRRRHGSLACDDGDDRLARYHFRAVPFGKGVTRGVTREGERDRPRRLPPRSPRTIRRH